MNYILHLNAWFEETTTRTDVNPTDMSVYFALFQLWNRQLFPTEFTVNRLDVMRLSKIGSAGTYSKCMKRLHAWGWIIYHPSTSCYGRSVVRMVDKSAKGGKNRKSSATTKQLTTDPGIAPSTETTDEPVVERNYKTKQTKENNSKENVKNNKPSNYEERM